MVKEGLSLNLITSNYEVDITETPGTFNVDLRNVTASKEKDREP